MSKNVTLLPDGNVFKATPNTASAVTATMRGLSLIRGLLENVPGNPFISEPDQYAILGRIQGYINKLGSDLGEYLALDEVVDPN